MFKDESTSGERSLTSQLLLLKMAFFQAKGDVIAFIDCHCAPQDQWHKVRVASRPHCGNRFWCVLRILQYTKIAGWKFPKGECILFWDAKSSSQLYRMIEWQYDVTNIIYSSSQIRFDRFYFSKNPAPFASVRFMRESLQRMSCPWQLMSPKKIYWCWFSVQVPEHVNNKTPISSHSEHSNICHISINLEQFHKSQQGCLHRMLLSLFPSLKSECCVASVLDLISILTRCTWGDFGASSILGSMFHEMAWWWWPYHNPSPKQPLHWFSPLVAPRVPDPAMLIPPGLFGEWFSLQGLVLPPLISQGRFRMWLVEVHEQVMDREFLHAQFKWVRN